MDVTPPFGTCSPGGALTGDNLRTQKTCVPTGAGVRSSHRGASQNAAVWANLGAGKAPARFVCWVWRLQLPRLHRASPPRWISTLQTVLTPSSCLLSRTPTGTFTAQSPEEVLTSGARSCRLRPGAHQRPFTVCVQSNCPDGALPIAGLILAADDDFYGTTFYGGADSKDCAYGCGDFREFK